MSDARLIFRPSASAEPGRLIFGAEGLPVILGSGTATSGASQVSGQGVRVLQGHASAVSTAQARGAGLVETAQGRLVFRDALSSAPGRLVFSVPHILGTVVSGAGAAVDLAGAASGQCVRVLHGHASVIRSASAAQGLAGRVVLGFAVVTSAAGRAEGAATIQASPPLLELRVVIAWPAGGRLAQRPAPAWGGAARVGVTPAAQWAPPATLATAERAGWAAQAPRQRAATARWSGKRDAQSTAVARHAAQRRAQSVASARWSTQVPTAKEIVLAGMSGVRRQQVFAARWSGAGHAGTVALARWLSSAQATAFVAARWPGSALIETHSHAWPVVPPAPTPDPCCDRSGRLVFWPSFTPPGRLRFVCSAGRKPIRWVPVLEAYTVTNDVMLRRASDQAPIECEGFSLSIDRDSWNWRLTAAGVPGSAKALLQPSSALEPVELEALVNGHLVRLVAERTRERTFGSDVFSVSGLGRAVLLDSPWAPTRSFTSPAARSAQQLANEAMTANGVSLGWGVDWQLEDWAVPGGVWSHMGTSISALRAIAAAVGGYVQAAADADTLRMMPAYAIAPWDWMDATPDFVLPADVSVQESFEWLTQPDYNVVYACSTHAAGARYKVVRAGTAGDTPAPMVSDTLLSAYAAGRQRGLSILGNTGAQAKVGVRVPLLDEIGLVLPGALVRYTDADGDLRVGQSRGLTLTATKLGEVWQSIGVETHGYQ